MNSQRTCGECIACCVYPRIEEKDISKPDRYPCPHLFAADEMKAEGERDGVAWMHGLPMTGSAKEKNCTIHGTPERPVVCGAYQCSWLEGHGTEEDRPDRTGYLIDNRKRIDNGLQAIPMRPSCEGAEESEASMLRISRSTGKVILVIGYGERRLRRVLGRTM